MGSSWLEWVSGFAVLSLSAVANYFLLKFLTLVCTHRFSISPVLFMLLKFSSSCWGTLQCYVLTCSFHILLQILEGKAYKLQFPWIGVVNRSQQDINKNVDMIAARRREREYFAQTPEYKHLASRMGSEHLGKVLSKVSKYKVSWSMISHFKYTFSTIWCIEKWECLILSWRHCPIDNSCTCSCLPLVKYDNTIQTLRSYVSVTGISLVDWLSNWTLSGYNLNVWFVWHFMLHT